jgi:hypothetical protein
VCALNLPLSPEKAIILEGADPISLGAGNTDGALAARIVRPPGVSDSIELDNGVGVTRQVSENPRFLAKHPGSGG